MTLSNCPGCGSMISPGVRARSGIDLVLKDASETAALRAEVAELKSKLAEEESTHEKCLAILMQREDDQQWEAHRNGFAQCEPIAWRAIVERDAALASLASLREAAGGVPRQARRLPSMRRAAYVGLYQARSRARLLVRRAPRTWLCG